MPYRMRTSTGGISTYAQYHEALAAANAQFGAHVHIEEYADRILVWDHPSRSIDDCGQNAVAIIEEVDEYPVEPETYIEPCHYCGEDCTTVVTWRAGTTDYRQTCNCQPPSQHLGQFV